MTVEMVINIMFCNLIPMFLFTDQENSKINSQKLEKLYIAIVYISYGTVVRDFESEAKTR